jgi:hypothetical protein
MKIQNLSIALILTLAFVFSCKKSETVVTPKTKTELLAGTVSKTWKNTKAQATNAQGLSIDLVISQPTCIVDNLIIFFPNKTYEFREGATKCNPADPDLLLKANWSFNATETQFTIDKISFLGKEYNNTTFDIVELTESIFVGKTTLAVNGVTYQFAATFEPVK